MIDESWIYRNNIHACVLDKSGKKSGIEIKRTVSSVDGRSKKLEFRPGWIDMNCKMAIEISFKVPISGVSGFWTPLRSGGFENQNFIKWEHSFVASSGLVYPVIAFVGRELGDRGLISFLTYNASSRFDINLSQVDECFYVKFRYPESGFLEPGKWDKIDFYVSHAGGSERKIFDAIREFVEYFDEDVFPPVPSEEIPDSAYEPVYCTWYAVHGSPSEEWADKTAELAADMGFGNFIMDDGWFHDKFQRVGVSLENWFEGIGDWVPSKEKFTDFGLHVKRVQEMGLKYILWYDPYAAGIKSRAFKEAEAFIGTKAELEGTAYYCVQDSRTHKKIIDTALRLVRDYGVDGFKIDFLYGTRVDNCEIPSHDHFEDTNGRGMARTMQEMYHQIKRVKPDFNMVHTGNPFLKGCSTSMRAIDVPFDADTNLYFLIYVKLFASILPVQSDPLYWAKGTSMEEIARHFMVAMFSVPSVSVDLMTLSGREKDLIRNWIQFYHKHKKTLNSGKFSVQNTGPLISAVTSESEEESITGVFRNAIVDLEFRCRNILFNGTDSNSIVIHTRHCWKNITMKSYDVDFNCVNEVKELEGEYIKIEVPAGGWAEFEM